MTTRDPPRRSQRRFRSVPSRSAGAIVAFAVGSVVLLILTIVALQVYFNQIWEEAVYEKVLAPPSEELKALHFAKIGS